MSIIDKSIQKLEASKEKKPKTEEVAVKEEAPVVVEQKETIPQPEVQSSSSVDEQVPLSNTTNNYVELDHKLLAEQGYITDISEKSIQTEEFRSLKRKVINNAFGGLSHTLEANNLIMVTSCSPSEGKTFNAINLALSIAQEKDKTVLLVDSDVLRPSISKRLNIEVEQGLTDYLSGKVDDLQDVLLSTSIDKLRVLPAGNFYSLSSELLASNKMIELVKEFASRYKDRIVIFDAPPMLGINETALLSELVGQILIVIEEDKTKMANIQKLVSLLPEKVAKGFIMNKSVTSQITDYGYGYGY